MPFSWESHEPFLDATGARASIRARHERVLEEWARSLVRSQRAARTIEGYLGTVAGVCDRLTAKGLFVFAVRRAQWDEHADSYLFPPRSDDEDRPIGWAPATQARTYAALSALFRWWIEVGDHDLRNPFVGIRRTKSTPNPLARSLTEDELAVFFNYLVMRMGPVATADGPPLLDYLVFSLAFSLALRASDLATMSRSRLQTPGRKQPWLLFAHRKGKKAREWSSFVVPDALRPALARWLEVRPDKVTPRKDRRRHPDSVLVRFGSLLVRADGAEIVHPRGKQLDDALFIVPGSGRPISRAWLNTRLRVLATESPLPKARAAVLSSHWFRHSKGQALKREGAHQVEIKEFMGHSSTAITDLYVGAEGGVVDALQRGAELPH
jgi:integrase